MAKINRFAMIELKWNWERKENDCKKDSQIASPDKRTRGMFFAEFEKASKLICREALAFALSQRHSSK